MPRRVLTLLTAILTVLPSAVAAQPVPAGLSVRTDPRVELLAIVFRLAGNPEYNQGSVPGYVRAIDAHFAAHREHPAVQEARRLRQQYGIGFDAVMSMALHVEGATDPRPRRGFASPDPSLERRWSAAEAESFARSLQAFVRDTRFGDFLAANQKTLDSARVRMERVVAEHLDLAAIRHFFGREPNGAFVMVPLVANAAGNFGTRYLEGDREEVYAIIGTSPDRAGIPAFDAGFIPTMVHEFSHSFVNPAVQPVSESFRAAGEAIYPLVEEQMRAQAYSNWLTMVNESLVRASVARYVRAHAGDSAAAVEVAAQRARGFLWTDELFELLAEYESDRARYPAFDAFLPRVAEYFAALAPRVADELAEYDRTRPRLVSSEPAHDASDVDPSLTRIVLRFDQPMTPRVNIRLGPGGREHYPEVSGVAWDETGTMLTLAVKLRPAWRYELVLGGGFLSRAERKPIRDTALQFHTR